MKLQLGFDRDFLKGEGGIVRKMVLHLFPKLYDQTKNSFSCS